SAITPLVTRINNGTMNVNTGGSTATFLEMLPGATGTATINLNGGSLALRQFSSDGTGAKAINFNGGTLISLAANNVGGTNFTSTVGAGGATFDVPITAAGTATAILNWSPALTVTSPGATLTKLGGGRLNLLGSGFDGPVTIRAGRLDAAGSVGANGSTLQLGDLNASGGGEAGLFLTAPGTIRGPINVGTGFGNYSLGVANNSAVSIPGPIMLNAPLTILAAANSGSNVLSITGGISNTDPFGFLACNNAGTIMSDGVGISDGAGGSLGFT